MSTQFIILAGVGYDAVVADRQVIFTEQCSVWSCHLTFALERPVDINDSGGIWYLVHLDSSSERVPMSHLVAAHEWCCREFGKSFEEYKGALSLSKKGMSK